MIRQQKNKLYLDLTVPIFLQLIHTGILKKNVNFSPVCTSCQNKEFFSYRKDGNKTYGLMLSVISLIN
jgi:copper oxidase (laccase) domain-containing protein